MQDVSNTIWIISLSPGSFVQDNKGIISRA